MNMTPSRLLGTAAGAALAAGALIGPTAAGAAQFTPVSARVVAPPAPVSASDGRRHLVYELELQNDQPVRVDVESLAVRADGRTLRTLGPSRIAAEMTVARRPASALAAGEKATLWLDVTVPGRRLPHVLRHRLALRLTAPNGETRTMTFVGARTRVDRRPTPAIAAPLRGGRYLDFNGCCVLGPHRTALLSIDGRPFLSERFAVDLIRIDRHGRGASGDPSRNESFLTYGENVHSVAGGRVVHTRGDVADNQPFNEPPGDAFTTETIVGNHVVVKLRDGRYATYAHLQPGSIRVRRGQRVKTGQVLARVGNSGQSGGAHLHFQLTDTASPVASNGLPFAFKRFTLMGAVDNVEQFLTGAADARLQPLASGAQRRGQFPLYSSVLRFPG